MGDNCSTVGIANPVPEDLRYYPNPVSNELRLDLPTNTGTISLSDITGKQVLKLVVSDYSMIINMSQFRPGIYFLGVNGRNYKIVKE